MSKLLIKNCRYLVTRPGSIEGIIEDGAVYIEGSKIVAVGKSTPIEAQYGQQPELEILDAREKAVLPGLVDAHNHVGEVHTLLVPGWLDSPITGITDAMDLMYWPAYNWLTEQSAYDLTLFGLLHVLKHGATTHADAMIFPEAIYRASVEAKMRTVIQPQMISSVQLADARDEQEYLQHTENAIQNFHHANDDRIRVAVHPSAIYNCSENLLLKAMDLASQYDVKFVTHIAESPDEIDKQEEIYAQEGGLIQHLRNLGLLGPRSTFFHGTLLKERDIDLLAETGSSLVHCPSTNAWFGYCAYLPYMLKADLEVGLGTDCVTHNMFNTMFSVMQHHNIMPRALRSVDPTKIFELATLGGAGVLGLEDQVGSLEAGKKADIITINLKDNSSLFPLSPQVFYAMLLLNGPGTEACDVLIDGVFLRRDSKFTFLDEAAIVAHARQWCDRFSIDYLRKKKARIPMFKRIYEEFQPNQRRPA